ncbi:hypothetical protein [Campylobacter troglodytis]|nr:hypothetical protein [Campylobacter troglodytis]
MLKRNGYIYTLNHCSVKELLSIIRDFADLENATILGKFQNL